MVHFLPRDVNILVIHKCEQAYDQVVVVTGYHSNGADILKTIHMGY